MTVPRLYAVVLPAYLAGLLALDTRVGLHIQLALGALTFLVLALTLRPLPPLVRAQAIGVVLFATVGEVTGSRRGRLRSPARARAVGAVEASGQARGR